MNDPQPNDPRRRIRELMAIPERDRTDAEWEELNELEIRTAPGNRQTQQTRDADSGGNTSYNAKYDRAGGKHAHVSGQPRRPDRNNQPGKNNGPRPDSRPQQEGRSDQRPAKRQHRRPKRPPGPPENLGNG
ncbi:MAG: hypothetical protein ABI478_02640 [Propionivibrio sp.]